MNTRLVGSDLTRAMLSRNDKNMWCAVSNDGDEHAMAAINNADYHHILRIVSFDNDHFVCKNGNLWQYAIPVKKIKLTQVEVGL